LKEGEPRRRLPCQPRPLAATQAKRRTRIARLLGDRFADQFERSGVSEEVLAVGAVTKKTVDLTNDSSTLSGTKS